MTESLATTQRGFLAQRPSFIKEGDVRGAESIGINDIKPPALRLAQSTTPETKRHEADKFIDGLREGEFFNSATKEVYGEGPIIVVVVKTLGHRNVEFDPQDKKVVLDFAVPDGDPRTQFTDEIKDGKKIRLKPKATLFYDYLGYVVREDGKLDLVQFSLKSTQLKKAKDLNTILAGMKMPTFAVQFKVTAVPERKKDYNFYGWRIDLAGYVTEDTYNEADKTFTEFADKTIVLETVADEDEATGGATTRIEPRADDIPF